LQEDFIAVEIVAQHIRFIWDVGGGAGEVEHPLKLEPGKSAEERNWYNIQIDRCVTWQWYINVLCCSPLLWILNT
jgi:hypothetical protein